ncbi:MAG: 50S ribosomal protein L21 [candidate division Zixibacteria bacterium]|nr:50S ribosomal protein L21 [candidate division Zixibacteria bacterium]
MYAVFEVSGSQFTAQEGDILKVPLQKSESGDKIDIENVLLIKDKDSALIGTPTVADAKIEAEVIGNVKNDKVLIFKYKRRTKYRRTMGHRQKITEIKINKIVSPGN